MSSLVCACWSICYSVLISVILKCERSEPGLGAPKLGPSPIEGF
jgi:hypothetical protein